MIVMKENYEVIVVNETTVKLNRGEYTLPVTRRDFTLGYLIVCSIYQILQDSIRTNWGWGLGRSRNMIVLAEADAG